MPAAGHMGVAWERQFCSAGNILAALTKTHEKFRHWESKNIDGRSWSSD